MRITHSKRAAQLASAVVAAGLVLAVAPQAVASDDGTLTLTDSQAQALADRMGATIDGGAATELSDDASAGQTLQAAPEASTDASTSAATGSGTAAVDPKTPVTFTAKSSMEGVRGLGATYPADGDKYFTVHALGNVQLHAADGSTLWERNNASLYADWGVKPLRVWEKEVYPARVLLGYNAVSPFGATAGHGVETADLTGDGVPDVVFAASVGITPNVGVTISGSTLTQGTVVTVLDGATGKTLWKKVYSYASTVKVVDGTLLVANAPRLNSRSVATETATLTGTRFAFANGVLTPSSTWTYDTTEVANASWGDIADLGDGRLAVSWSKRKATGIAPQGHTLVLNAATGAVVWERTASLYGRMIQLDAARGRLVAIEQTDTSDAVSYAVVSYALANGERDVLSTRVNAVATAMTIGDAAAAAGEEYVVAESTLAPNLYINASTVRVLKGDTGASAAWTSTVKRDAANSHDAPAVWDLDVIDGMLVTSAQDDHDMFTADNIGGLRYGTLTAYTNAGKVKWQEQGLDASPMFHQVYTSGDTAYVRTVDQSQNIRTFTLAKGKAKGLTPLRGEVNFAKAVDVDGNGKVDVVAGGNSNAVWAWDGRSLLSGTPKQLWTTTVPGEVRDIETGDVNGDGRPDVVVAADTATVVLDGATGNVLTTIDGAGAFVRSVTVADVNADGKDEVLVPTDALRVYNARGKELWTYQAPAGSGDVVFSDAVSGDGQVYAQYASVGSLDLADGVQNGVALNGKTGALVWAANPVAPSEAIDGKLHGAVLRGGVFASSKIPYADGHAVVYQWIMNSTSGGTSAASPHVVVEIRDGRTGELLHQSNQGSPWSFDNFFIDKAGDPLYRLSFGTFTGFGAGGVDTYSSVAAPLRGAQFATGPGGRQLLVGGIEAGVGAWDPSVLTSGYSFQSSVGSTTQTGNRSYLAVDLDDDGQEEMIALNFDAFGVNRAAELLGGGVLSLDDGILRVTTYKLS